MFINESFLSFLWQFQYFDKSSLRDSDGDDVVVISPGLPNTDQGPDFSDAIIRIGEVTWHGAVEIHVHASQWTEHRHSRNSGYDHVILHVVWKNDEPVYRSDNSPIPALELEHKIPDHILLRFHQLINNQAIIPCASDFNQVPPVHFHSMLDTTLVERLKEKAGYVLEMLSLCENDWEEVSYRMIMRNFGFKINQHPMLALATYLPFKLIRKHSDQPHQIEAMLFGTAGFLKENSPDEYHSRLKSEFEFLNRKYHTINGFLARHQWKFMRTHPANFPTVRIAQAASFFSERKTLFRLILDCENLKDITGIFNASPNDYWKTHFDFGKKFPGKSGLGKSSIQNLVINTYLPVLGAYGIYMDDSSCFERAIRLLEQIPPEKNRITRIWESLATTNRNAADSQAMIQLYNQYCIKKKCLNCKVGAKILYPDDWVPGS